MAILSIRGRRQGVWTSSEVTGRSRRVRRKKWLLVELLERRCLLSAIHLSFDAPAIYKVDNCPSSLTIGDFNGDGRNDLAVVNAGLYPNYNGTVSILLGNADGAVPAKVDYPAGYRPFAVAVGDFNGDGHGDLVVSNSDGTTGILLGKGDGTFQAMVSYAVGGEVAVGDFNGDGRSDLALTNRNNNTVGILLAAGDGTFKPIVNYAVGTSPAAVAVGDFDNNGKSDLAVANEGDNTVSILRGNGDGTFLSRIDYAWGGTGKFNLFSVVAGDFNGDGHSDLAVSSESCSAPYSGEVDILQGAGDGTFHTATTIDGVDGYLTVGDFNKDGRSDLAVASFGAAVDILLAKNDGTFQPTTSYTISYGNVSMAVGDLNGDGLCDLAVANQGGSDGAGTVGILLGHGDGTFQNNQDPFVGSEPISLAVGDFNEDGRSDLAVANYGDNTVSILISNGDRTFKTKADYAVGSEPMCVAVGDFNGDGHSDLAVANFDSGMGSTVSIMMGKGDGTFESKVDYTAGYGPCSLAVGDFNHDGKSDLAVVDRDDGTIMLLLNQGDGTFSGYPVATLHCVAYSIGVGDFDNDGMTDFAAANWTGSGVCIGWAKDNTGDRFNTSSYQVSGAPYSVAVGDYNGDGHSDLAVACQFGYVDIYCFGNNYPTGVNRMRYTVGNDARSVAVGDFDGDGKGDLAVANYGDNTVSILRGNGDGSFQLKTDYPVGKQPTCVAVGDFDGDGRSDLAVANYGDDRVSIGWNLIGTTTVLTSSSGTTVTGQSVTFTATITPASGNGMTGTVQFQVDGGNVGNPVAVSGGTAAYTTSALPVGSHSITAVYSGDASFAGSTSVALSQSVSKVAPKISWGAPAAITYGVRLSGGQLNATADVPGAFVYDTPVGTVLPAGSQTLRVTFTPNDAANYLTTTATVPLTVNKAILLVTTDPKTKTYGQVNPALTGTLTDLVAVDGITAIWATAAGQFDHPGNYAITATLSDPNNKLSNYAVTNAGSTLTISKAGQTLTWATPAAITNGLPLGSGQLNASVTGVASGSTPGSLSYTPAAGAVLSAGNNTLTVTAAATADYNQAIKSVILTVNPNTAPVGSIDACDRTVVRGWAFDQDFGAGSILVRVDLDGVTGTPFAANLARADLASYAPVGSPNHGFSFAMPTLGAGSHTVDVWVQDSPGTAYMKLGTRTIPASVTPFGSVDACDRTKVAGWAFDGDAGDASILVRVDVDGVAGTPFVANLSRADLTSYAPVGSPKHGFSFTMPTLSPAAHTVAVYAQDVAGNGLVLISPTKTLPATVSSGGGAVLTPKAGDAKSFFDEAFYLAANPDVAAAVKAGAITAWNHFWNYGQYEGRRPSNLYDEKFYLATYTDIAGAVKAGSFKDGFAHFVTYGYAEGRKGVVTPKAGDAKSFFDPGYYLARNPDVAAVVKAGTITAWDHFWNHGQYEGRRPSSIYDESFYLATYPDIAAAVKAGVFKDGFAHFAAYGFGEGRKGVGA